MIYFFKLIYSFIQYTDNLLIYKLRMSLALLDNM